MRKAIAGLIRRIQLADPNEKNFWLGLLLLFLGLTWSRSVFVALTIVGAVLALESVITSYLAAFFTERKK